MCVPLIHVHFHPIKLACARHLRSDMELLYSLSFGRMVHQAYRQFTPISRSLVPIQSCLTGRFRFCVRHCPLGPGFAHGRVQSPPTGVCVFTHP